MKNHIGKIFTCLFVFCLVIPSFSKDSDKDNQKEKYDPVSTVMHHIGDANEFHIFGDIHLPLPCILYAPEQGFSVFMSSVFDHGSKAIDGYVLNHGRVNRIKGGLEGRHELEAVHGTADSAHPHYIETEEKEEKEANYVYVNGTKHELEKPSTLIGFTSFYDFSITKNVFGMLVAGLILLIVFFNAGRLAKKRKGQAPKGIQSFIEPFFIFIRDEVTRPMIGEKHYERFQPFIMTLFFFILTLNLLGLVPFFPGSANVTGNISVTLVLAVFAFLVTNLNGNRHYWGHLFWMPGIPAFVKLILTPVEVLGAFIIKPASLMIRLFANITAGHIIILSLVGLIFIFGESGENIGGAFGGMALTIPFTMFMNIIELIVAFIQAFIFAILTASYIGTAVEEHEHHEHAHAHEAAH